MSVYTTVTASQLEGFLEQYDLGSLVAFEGIQSGIENTNYFVDTLKGRYVLTLFENHAASELDYYLGLMNHLADAGIHTPKPERDKTGRFLSQLCQKPATLVKRLKGKEVESDELGLGHLTTIGREMANYQKVAKSYPGERTNDRDWNWMQATLVQLKDQLPVAEVVAIEEELQWQLDGYQQGLFATIGHGIIHADLFLDNVLFESSHRVLNCGIIDWYYACNDYWLYDLAVLMNDWSKVETSSACYLDAEQANVLALAYATVLPFSDADRKAWPYMQRKAALRFYLSRLKDQLMPKDGELTLIKDPQVYRRLLTSLQTAPYLLP